MERSVHLRLSAQRALLGAISCKVRQIQVVDNGHEITFTVIVAAPLNEAETDALSVAATEIVADYSDRIIAESIIVDSGPLRKLSCAECVFQRLE